MKKRITASALALVMALSVCVTATLFKNIYSLYNPFSGEHLYSLDDGEISWLEECGWNQLRNKL